MRNFIVMTVLMGIVFLVASYGSVSVVGYTADFINLGIDARNFAMGNSSGANYGNIWSAINNPAAIPDGSDIKLSGIQQKLFEDTQYNTYGLSFPLLILDCAVQYHKLSIGGIAKTSIDLNGKPVKMGGDFNSNDEAVIISLAKSIVFNENFLIRFGVNAKAIQETIMDNQGQGLGGDAGIIVKLGNIQLGYSMINCMSGEVLWNTPMQTKETMIAKKISAIQINSDDKSFVIAMSLHQEGDNAGIFHIGGSYNMFGILEFRAGLNDASPTYGLGLKLDRLSIDYGTQLYINDSQNESNTKLTVELIL